MTVERWIIESRRAASSIACLVALVVLAFIAPPVRAQREPQYPTFEPWSAAFFVLLAGSFIFAVLSMVRREKLWPIGLVVVTIYLFIPVIGMVAGIVGFIVDCFR